MPCFCFAVRRGSADFVGHRALQCGFNALESRGKFSFLPDTLRHGDALLFMLASAQVMYAYVLRPESIPESYYKFIVKTCVLYWLAVEVLTVISIVDPSTAWFLRMCGRTFEDSLSTWIA